MLNINLPPVDDRTRFWLIRLAPVLLFLGLLLLSGLMGKCSGPTPQLSPGEVEAVKELYANAAAERPSPHPGERVLILLGYILTFVSAVGILLDLLSVSKASPRRLAVAALAFLMGLAMIREQPLGYAIAIALIAISALFFDRPSKNDA